MPHLVGIEVHGLLWSHHHYIQFPATDEFVIIHGPNGVGKTRLLELIKAIADQDWAKVASTPFVAAQIEFDDGTYIDIDRSDAVDNADLERTGSSRSLGLPLAITLIQPDSEALHWRPRVPGFEDLARFLENEIPQLVRTGVNEWRDIHSSTDGGLTLNDVLNAYPDEIASSRRLRELIGRTQAPTRISEFLASFDVRLIETQRLLQLDRHDRTDPRARADYRSPREVKPAVTVENFAEQLSIALKAAQAENSRTTQALDRTFPGRLLMEGGEAFTPHDDDQIRARYAEQTELRRRLSRIDVLEAVTFDVTLPDRELAVWERRVLWLYLDDAAQKLATFDEISQRVELFRDLINARFLGKELVIDRGRGFRVATSDGRSIALASLSSGEQHEMVIFFGLIFNVQPGALVLIDEPEISLHISWQQKFMDDLLQIARVTSARFIVATHSPQIMNKWWRKSVSLSGLAGTNLETK
ncbi:AAA family ATPase [Nakamurella deserti]|uniref:AAA family ATPase n=1 Tax=Nakamurella deserti TaxID=2164074 RepID=UPI000DBE3487|nr:AAA family ATPase [Nakamurella deserti]